MPDRTALLMHALQRYRDQWQGEAVLVDEFREFLHTYADAFDRTHHSGHFTGSSWLVSDDGVRVLLMQHRKLNRWPQPGGHADGDRDLARVALRETQEETGAQDLREGNVIFDLDRHRIPARDEEAEHWHYDVRYVVRASADERCIVNDESHRLAWRPVQDVADDSNLDASLRRMARKWLARCPWQ